MCRRSHDTVSLESFVCSRMSIKNIPFYTTKKLAKYLESKKYLSKWINKFATT